MPSSLCRRSFHAAALAIVIACALAATVRAEDRTDPIPPVAVTPGFTHLVDLAPDVVGQPIESERPGDVDGSTIVRTTTGLLYWQPDLSPTWTNGYERLTLDVVDQVRKWVGDLLKPPTLPTFNFSFGGGGVDGRIYCIEGIESGHGRAMWNRTDINGVFDGPGPHAHGFLGWLDGTAAHWGAIVGNRDSEWAAARRMFASTTEAFMRTQFYGVGAGRC